MTRLSEHVVVHRVSADEWVIRDDIGDDEVVCSSEEIARLAYTLTHVFGIVPLGPHGPVLPNSEDMRLRVLELPSQIDGNTRRTRFVLVLDRILRARDVVPDAEWGAAFTDAARAIGAEGVLAFGQSVDLEVVDNGDVVATNSEDQEGP